MRSIFWGILLVLLGAYLLVSQFYEVPGIGSMWPVLLILGGLSLYWNYIKNRHEGVLLPATILTLLGAFFLLFTSDYYDWNEMGTVWPIFIIIIGVAFLIVFLASWKWGTLIPASVLLVIGGAFLAANMGYLEIMDVKTWWPAALIVVGILVIWGALRGGKSG